MVHVHECAEENTDYFLYCSLLLPWDTVSHWTRRSVSVRLYPESTQCWGLQAYVDMPGFLHGAWDLNLDHVCKASTLSHWVISLTQPSTFLLLLLIGRGVKADKKLHAYHGYQTWYLSQIIKKDSLWSLSGGGRVYGKAFTVLSEPRIWKAEGKILF